MNKPLILVEQEMKETLVNTINEYSKELPMSMILSTLNTLVSSCTDIAEQQLKNAQKAYQAELEKEQNDMAEQERLVQEDIEAEENKEQTDESV